MSAHPRGLTGGPRPQQAELLLWSSFGPMLVRREDDGGVRGPQGSWGRPEESVADQGTGEDGRGAGLQTWGQGSRRYGAQSSWTQGTGEEPCRQDLRELLLQGQLSLEPEKTGQRFPLTHLRVRSRIQRRSSPGPVSELQPLS